MAKKHKVSADDLKKSNNMDNSNIHYGQDLIVSQSTTEANNKTKNNTELKSKSIRHKVKSGESYYSLAQKYNCTMNELKEWNDKTGSKLNIGDNIIIHIRAGK